MFNNTAVYLGDWKAVKNALLGDKQWKLFNVTKDIGENNDLTKEYPDLTKEYPEYCKIWYLITISLQKE